MFDFFILQNIIKFGLAEGDFIVTIRKFHTFKKGDKDYDDKKWTIQLIHPKERINNLRIFLNKKELSCPQKYILEMGTTNVLIPKNDFTEGARVKVWDGKKILKNIKFEDLSPMDD